MLCSVLGNDRKKECGNTITDPKPYNLIKRDDGSQVGICDECLGIGQLEEKPVPLENGLFSCVWLRQIAPEVDKKGNWWARHEIDSHHYYCDGKEIEKDMYMEMLEALQRVD